MMLLKQSTARNRVVWMADSADHVTGKAGLTLTITASKDGGAFGSISPTVTERGNGWYNLALTASHTDTVGDLALHITGTGADPTDLVDQVVLDLPGATVTLAATGSAALTESYPADGAAPTLAQFFFMIWSRLSEFSIAGTTVTAKQLDGTTTAMTFTINDNANPTSITRAT